MGAAVVIVEDFRSRENFAALKMRLDDWALWGRRYGFGLGFSKINVIGRLMIYGPGAAHTSGRREEPPVPADVADIEAALLDLAKLHDGWFQALRLSHLERKPDSKIAKSLGVDVVTFRGWRKCGYCWLDGKLS